MNIHLMVAIDDKDVRFTPEGKVAALDAIGALSDHLPAERLWEEFLRDNPEVDCTEYTFPGDETLCVIDGRVMQQVEDWLFDRTVERMANLGVE